MGKGRSVRKRAQRHLHAQEGNLYKAQFGKVNTALALPPPPDAAARRPYLPRSLRMMIAAQKSLKKESDPSTSKRRQGKGAAEERERGGRSKGEESARREPAQAPAEQSDDATHEPNQETSQNEAFTQPDVGAEAATQRGEDQADASTSEPGQKKQAKAGAGRESKAGRSHAGELGVQGSVFEQPKRTKTKQKRKAFLKRKKLRRRSAGALEEFASSLHEKEMQVDVVGVGEQASAPPKVSLKRKHWTAVEAENRDAAASRRCRELFLRQLKEAGKKLHPQPGSWDGSGQRSGSHGFAMQDMPPGQQLLQEAGTGDKLRATRRSLQALMTRELQRT